MLLIISIMWINIRDHHCLWTCIIVHSTLFYVMEALYIFSLSYWSFMSHFFLSLLLYTNKLTQVDFGVKVLYGAGWLVGEIQRKVGALGKWLSSNSLKERQYYNWTQQGGLISNIWDWVDGECSWNFRWRRIY